VYNPKDLFALLSKLEIDHPSQVSSSTCPAVVRLCGHKPPITVDNSTVAIPDGVRTEFMRMPVEGIYDGDVVFHLMMMGDSPYFLYANVHAQRSETIGWMLYDKIIRKGITIVKDHWAIFEKIQHATKLVGLNILFCLRDGKTPCILALQASMGVRFDRYKRIVSLMGPDHIQRVRDALIPRPIGFDMMFPDLKLKRSLILTGCPKTGGTTVKAFLQTHFSACYTLYRPKDGDYELHDRHGQRVVGIQETNFIMFTTHHGTCALVPRFMTRSTFDAALKVVTVRNVWTRIGSIYKGSHNFCKHPFDRFVKLFLNKHYCRITPMTYYNMSREAALIHLNPQATWLEQPHDDVIHLETLVDDFRKVMNLITDAHYDSEWLNHGRKNAREPYTIEMNDESRSIIEDFYKEDIIKYKLV
jgi:hypothetical protein